MTYVGYDPSFELNFYSMHSLIHQDIRTYVGIKYCSIEENVSQTCVAGAFNMRDVLGKTPIILELSKSLPSTAIASSPAP